MQQIYLFINFHVLNYLQLQLNANDVQQLDLYAILVLLLTMMDDGHMGERSNAENSEKMNNLRNEEQMGCGENVGLFPVQMASNIHSAEMLRHDLRRMAVSLSQLQLTNVQIALMAAILLFERLEVGKQGEMIF